GTTGIACSVGVSDTDPSIGEINLIFTLVIILFPSKSYSAIPPHCVNQCPTTDGLNAYLTQG
ncbi:hypothetical protein, partial [Enterobacter hormaechei]|uniref:hypothetical protein n=1 Tax=Enterobacter hormaechei TaxID=158836 RepID=UPI0039C2AAD3